MEHIERDSVIDLHVGHLDYYWRELYAVRVGDALVHRLLGTGLRHLKVVIIIEAVTSIFKAVLSCG